MKQFKQNTIKSFKLAREDITSLYEHIRYLHAQIGLLKEENKRIKAKFEIKRQENYVASKTGKRVHKKSCAFAKNIKANRKVEFATKSLAVAQGYIVCPCAII
jgi:hypothetical protein